MRRRVAGGIEGALPLLPNLEMGGGLAGDDRQGVRMDTGEALLKDRCEADIGNRVAPRPGTFGEFGSRPLSIEQRWSVF